MATEFCPLEDTANLNLYAICEKGPDYEMRSGRTIAARWEGVKKGQASADHGT
jgi:hypothetical protein